jgi:hypothetical protein
MRTVSRPKAESRLLAKPERLVSLVPARLSAFSIESPMISNSARYRKAAAACRKTAESSSTPAEWLCSAADWEKRAAEADLIIVLESDGIMLMSASVFDALMAPYRRMLH